LPQPRRTKVDTIAAAVKAAGNVGQKIKWPTDMLPRATDAEMAEREGIIFDALIKERAIDDWTQSNVLAAAKAASFSAMLVHERQKLDEEGTVILAGKHGNTPFSNPRMNIVSQLQALITNSLRQLGLAAPATDARQLRNSAKAAQAAEKAISAAQNDSLLA